MISSSSATASPSRSNPNTILAALSPAEFAELSPHLTPCLLHLGQTLHERGDEVKQIYFPKNGVISLVLGSKNGVDVEVGLIGREALTGVPEILTGNPSMARAIVQIAGSGWRIPAPVLRAEFARGGALQEAVLRCWYSQNQQTAQCVLCNRLHPIEQRLARWLLMCQDRVQNETLELTHEFLGNMLGTRRVGVTIAAGALRTAGLINYERGQVHIIDREGLESRACECYALIRQSVDSLNGDHQNLSRAVEGQAR